MKLRYSKIRYGTTKLSNAIQGYTGFLPQSDVNKIANLHGKINTQRTTYIKNNIVEN